ncbi:DUF3331 domain-containing protein [Paraburkholderia caledonica]|uniref:DUF3331 domain-containing protein n=1 Tax=Paraburkholderia caledonica TaxID=134536 RepID=UPI0037097FF8
MDRRTDQRLRAAEDSAELSSTSLWTGVPVDQYVAGAIAWQRTVGQLDAGCAQQLADRVRHIVDSRGSSRLPATNDDVVINLLDRPSRRTATVSWRAPRGCNYCEQVWRLATAQCSGICVLSGQGIAAGNAIYRPTKVEPPPANAGAMILSTVVEFALIDRCR